MNRIQGYASPYQFLQFVHSVDLYRTSIKVFSFCRPGQACDDMYSRPIEVDVDVCNKVQIDLGTLDKTNIISTMCGHVEVR